MVEIFVYIYFADEVSVFADGGEQFEYSFYYCEQDRLFYLIQFVPSVFGGVFDFDSLFDCFDLQEQPIEGFVFEEFSGDESLVDIDDFFFIIEENVDEVEYF